ncbi:MULTISPECIES: hypothetical protein [unclassified Streptomyces]|uniref:hypothetical protein n=1 Tax=unclassified Streptomyces TaxID=2593676 RepID=UPI00131A2D4B|nr:MULTISPECIES: hypothetical protein [unclassified Streptomyces]MYX37069.1 hypothetical protein [Streptomyces sp. SID8377]
MIQSTPGGAGRDGLHDAPGRRSRPGDEADQVEDAPYVAVPNHSRYEDREKHADERLSIVGQ